MNRCLLFLVACLGWSTLTRAEDPAWKTFTSKAGRFSISLPGKPAEMKQQVSAPTGKLELHFFTVAPAEGSAYVLYYYDYPKGAIKEDKREGLIESVCDGYVKQVGGKQVARTKVTLGKEKHPGREVVVEMPEKKQFYRARVYLAGNRLYQVMTMGPNDFARGKKADEFFDSFRVEE